MSITMCLYCLTKHDEMQTVEADCEIGWDSYFMLQNVEMIENMVLPDSDYWFIKVWVILINQ